MQAQKEEQQQYNRQEEYLSAQRAAVEAVLVGRETVQQAVQQGEQLDRAEALADETQYKLDKAGRILRGMTWSGWVANMFTRDVGPPPDAADALGNSHDNEAPMVYENLPESCRQVGQAIQNYHANVNVLVSCETEEQKNTCNVICDEMYRTASKAVESIRKEKEYQGYVTEFDRHLNILREKQQKVASRRLDIPTPPAQLSPFSSPTRADTGDSPLHAELFHGRRLQDDAKPAPTTSSPLPSSPLDSVRLQQDEHLNFLSQNLQELGSIASSLNQAVAHQNQTLDTLDYKSDNILEKSKLVTRRTDRIIQTKTWWKPVKAVYAFNVSMRHVESGKYLAVVNGDLYLVPKFHPETCVYGLWKRQGQIFGLRSKFSGRWVGQSLLGALACSATSFGRREEWEADHDSWNNTKLLCASAGWGAGGYLYVRPRDFAVLIGGSGVEERRNADSWCIAEQGVDNNAEDE